MTESQKSENSSEEEGVEAKGHDCARCGKTFSSDDLLLAHQHFSYQAPHLNLLVLFAASLVRSLVLATLLMEIVSILSQIQMCVPAAPTRHVSPPGQSATSAKFAATRHTYQF